MKRYDSLNRVFKNGVERNSAPFGGYDGKMKLKYTPSKMQKIPSHPGNHISVFFQYAFSVVTLNFSV